MNIPFFDLTRQYEEIRAEAEQSVTEVMRSTAYIEGDATKKLEEEMASYLGVKHAVTCGNGTDALVIALQAAGIRQGDEVITTPFTFFATAEAVAAAGAVPVFADIREDTLNLDPESIKKKITDRTKAILPVHIFGLPADMDEINDIAGENGLRVIEDACQAIGAVYKGKKTGTLSSAGCFSFYPTKNLGAFGDGGMITTDDDGIATVCRALKAHGAGMTGAKAFSEMTGETVSDLEALSQTADALYDPCKYYNYVIGGNSRLDSMQAAVLRVKLRRLERYNEKRRQIAEKYTKAFADLPLVIPQQEKEGMIHCRHQYAVLCDQKEALMAFLGKAGIGTGAFYPVPLHLQRVFGSLGYRTGDLQVAEHVCERSVCLPVFPELTEAETDYIIQSVRAFFNN